MEQNRDIALKISGVKKRYRLGTIGGGTLQGDLQSWWARVRGKEDPNLRIGQTRGNKNEVFMALDGIDLTVYKGERLGIIGHNGAGKSTLLKLLSRVTAPTEGEICIDGRISSMLEVGTGFNPELTGRENIYLNGAILGMSKAEIDSKVEEIIEFSECRQFIDTPVKRYSSGMYVKLAFAVAAHLDSEILIMDEVLAVGDMAFQKKCLDKMSQVSNDEGRTVLYVSHNMNTIRQLCNRCVVLDHGTVVFDGGVDSAIAVYMEYGRQVEYAPDVDLTALPHIPKTSNKAAELIAFQVTDRDDVKYHIGEKLTAELGIRLNAQASSLCFRTMVYNNDERVVGMATTLLGDMPQEEGFHRMPVVLDISTLAPGRYYLKFAIYYVDEFGNTINIDSVDKAVGFSVEMENTANKMVWDKKWWGDVMLPKIEVKK